MLSKRLPTQLVGGVAGDLAERAVDEQPAAFGVDQAGADRGVLEDLLEAFGAARSHHVGAAASGDVEHHRDPAVDVRAVLGSRAAVAAERPGVDHQAVAFLGRPDLARTRLTFERGAEQRLEAFPELGRERVRDVVALAADLGVSHPLDRLPGRQHEAQSAVEDDHERLGELAQGGARGVVGAGEQLSVRGIHQPCIGCLHRNLDCECGGFVVRTDEDVRVRPDADAGVQRVDRVHLALARARSRTRRSSPRSARA